jgi:hypothetical protein
MSQGAASLPSRLRSWQNDKESDHLKIVDPGELAFDRVGATRREEAGHGPLLSFTGDRDKGFPSDGFKAGFLGRIRNVDFSI